MKHRTILLTLIFSLYACSEGGTGGTGGVIIPPDSVTFDVTGLANKGPFAPGSTVTVTELNAAGQMGATTTTSTTDNGRFDITIEEGSVHLISVEGSFYSELTGAFTDDTMVIRAVFAGTENDAANVNVLTHLIHERVVQLMSDGSPADTAIDTAEDELTLALSSVIPSPDSDDRFSDWVVLNTLQGEGAKEQGNGYLLAFSSILEQHAELTAEDSGAAPRSELVAVLDEWTTDLAADGEIELGSKREALLTAQQRLNPNEIHQHLFEFDESYTDEVLVGTDDGDEHECRVSLDRLQCIVVEATAGSTEPSVAVDVLLTSIVADMNSFIDSDGDGVTNADDADDDDDGIDDQDDASPFEQAHLMPTVPTTFTEYLKAGLRQWSGVSSRQATVSPFVAGVAVPAVETVDSVQAVAEASADAADAGGFTTTNVLVAGVDEIDPVKYDGQHLFLANSRDVQVLRTSDEGAPAEVVGQISVGDEYSGIQGMYLSGDSETLVTISGGQVLTWFVDWFAPWGWNGKTELNMLDVTDVTQPTIGDSLIVDGSYVNSRRIGDVLYLITRFTPTLEGLHTPANSETERDENEQLIEDIDPDELLPKVTYLDGTTANLVTTDSCFLPPTQKTDAIEYPTLTTITAINVNNPSDLTSVCLTDGIQGIHMSLDAVYLAALDSSWDEVGFYSNTVIHKFSIAGQVPEYVASGRVEGSFWGDPTFLMGEHEGNLTVVTSRQTFDERQVEHILTVLGESENELRELGRIPSDTSQGTIGKPGEQIYASRIFGDRAYIVTFQQVDPVYVIDLADPAAPTILGELEIPGFSTYLHPVGDDLLLGIGRDTETVDGQVFFDGINVRLFDVSNPAQLNVLSDISIGQRGTETPVAWSPHAFSLLSDDSTGVHRFSVPIRVHGAHLEDLGDLQPWRYTPFTHEALYLFEVDESTRTINERGQIIANDFDTGYRFAANCCTWQERSFLDGDLVHYLRNNRLYTAFWDSPGYPSETFIPTVFSNDDSDVCTEEARNGLHVGVSDRMSGMGLSCAKVSVRDGDFSATIRRGCENADDAGETLIEEGLYERPGTYEIAAQLDGYEDWLGTGVVVQADQCHVQPTYIEILLAPLE